MAFSTQKDLLNYQLIEDQHDSRCAKNGAIKLKSYGSSIDTRAFDLNKKGPANYISDIVSCRTGVLSTCKPSDCHIGDGSNKYPKMFHTESEIQNLRGSVSFENPSDGRMSVQLQSAVQELNELKHKLQVNELGFRNVTAKNKILKQLLDTSSISDKCIPLLETINQLYMENKITSTDEEQLQCLVKGLSVSLENVDKLQNQVYELKLELNKKQRSEDNDGQDSRIESKSTKPDIIFDEPYEKVLHERNKLKFQLCRMADFEDKIKALKQKALRSDCLEHQLRLANQKLLAIQLSANKQMEASCEKEKLKKQLRDAQAVLCENYNLKKEFTKVIIELTRIKSCEKELELAKNDLCRYELIVRDYESQLKQLMEIIEELKNDKTCTENKLTYRISSSQVQEAIPPDCRISSTQVQEAELSDYQMQELTEISRATLEQMHLELKARNLLQIELETTRGELEILRTKCNEKDDKLVCVSNENCSIKEILDKVFDDMITLMNCPCNSSDVQKNEDTVKQCARKTQILKNELMNLKHKYECEIEDHKNQIEELTLLKNKAEEANRIEQNSLASRMTKSNETIMKQEMITKIQQKTLEDTERALNEQKKLVASFKEDLEEQKTSIQRSRLSVHGLETEINNLNIEKNELIKDLKENANTIEKLKVLIDKLQKDLESAEHDLEKINDENAIQIAEFLDKISNLEVEVAKAKTECVEKDEAVKTKQLKNKEEDDKRMVEVYALKEMDRKKNKDLNRLLDDVESKLSKCTHREGVRYQPRRQLPLRCVATKLKQDLEKEDEKQKTIQKFNIKNKRTQTNSDKLKRVPTDKKKLASDDDIKSRDSDQIKLNGDDDTNKMGINLNDGDNNARPKNANDIKTEKNAAQIGDTSENVFSDKLKLSPLTGLTLYSCYTPVTMTKLQIVCKKIFDYGIDCLTVKELTYLHCYIYKAGLKQKPEILHSIPNEQKCCKCSNFSCCLPNILRDAEKRLDARLKTIERDVEILDKSLIFLKQRDDCNLSFEDIESKEYDSSSTMCNTNMNTTLFSMKRKDKLPRNKSPSNKYYDVPTRDIAI